MMCEFLGLTEEETNGSDTLTTVCEESLDVESCVSCGSLFIWGKTLRHCDFLNTRTEKKKTLPESGTWQLHSLQTGI